MKFFVSAVGNQIRYWSIGFQCLRSYSSKKALKIISPKQDNKKILYEAIKNLSGIKHMRNHQDVDCLRNEVLKLSQHYSVKTIDRILVSFFLDNKDYISALNYISFLDESIKSKLKLYLVNQIFRIYFFKNYNDKVLTIAEQQHIFTEYESLKKTFPVLDVHTLENAILAFSVTEKWKNCLKLLEEIRKIDQPGHLCLSALTATAFTNNENELGWNTLREIFERGNSPSDVVFQAYLGTIEKGDSKNRLTALGDLFRECADKDIIYSEKIINYLDHVLHNCGVDAKRTVINKRGFCSICKKRLNKIEIDEEVFNTLKKKVIENIIVGKNIFTKTTPEEFSRFQKFLEKIDKNDIVIDGLNVAYTAGTRQTTDVLSSLLAHVVRHFANKSKDIVVLGRAHMSRWPAKHWNFIRKNSRVFLTQDISQDDPYLLWCALHSGKDTIIVSRDLMRSHLFLMKDAHDKLLFSRWLGQIQHQLIFVTDEGKVHFEVPLPYTRIIQETDGVWHIPFNTTDSLNDNNNSENWLCISDLHKINDK